MEVILTVDLRPQSRFVHRSGLLEQPNTIQAMPLTEPTRPLLIGTYGGMLTRPVKKVPLPKTLKCIDASAHSILQLSSLKLRGDW